MQSKGEILVVKLLIFCLFVCMSQMAVLFWINFFFLSIRSSCSSSLVIECSKNIELGYHILAPTRNTRPICIKSGVQMGVIF